MCYRGFLPSHQVTANSDDLLSALTGRRPGAGVEVESRYVSKYLSSHISAPQGGVGTHGWPEGSTRQEPAARGGSGAAAATEGQMHSVGCPKGRCDTSSLHPISLDPGRWAAHVAEHQLPSHFKQVLSQNAFINRL